MPQKIKLFIWKACKDILPINLNLYRKKISSSLTCELCDEDPESMMHVLVHCQFAQEVWRHIPLASILNWPPSHLFADFIHHGLQILNSPDIELFFTIAWRLWTARNDRKWDNHQIQAKEVYCQAGCYVQEFLNQKESDQEQQLRPAHHWFPPCNRDFKINVVVQWRKQSNSGSVGIVIQDSSGHVKAALGDHCSTVGDVTQLFASAILKSLWLALYMRLQRVLVEGDCKDLMDDLNSSAPYLSPYGTLVEELKQFVPLFSSIQFKFISQSCNVIRSCLVKNALSFNSCKIWFGECSNFLTSYVHNDSLHA